MLKSKHIDKLCLAALALAVALVLLFLFLGQAGVIRRAERAMGYVDRLFDQSRVHTVDIVIDDWQGFVENAQEEEYALCSVAIDGEVFRQVGIRTKGNNSLRLTGEYGLSRYSLKLEFDHFNKGGHYYGLDKFSLDSFFQDNSCLKSFFAFDMMSFMGVPTPLASYVWVTVNGVDWGLFLAIEEPEEAFAKRVYGEEHGQLYKPSYRSLKAENADVALRYTSDDPKDYDNIFRNAKFKISEADQLRLIEALKTLSAGEDLESAVNVDEVLRYFTVQVFVMNWDSYLGRTGHNYFLYEEDGVLSILPWDYNLAFGTYALGMTDPIRDPNIIINYPIDTPAEGSVMLNRPLYHNLMKNNGYFARYHAYFDTLISAYFESGLFEERLAQIEEMIAPYVEKDPTAYCSYEDHQLAVETFQTVCLLRAQSIRGQLDGSLPSTLREQSENAARVDASSVDLRDLGDFDDLTNAKEKQDAAMARVCG